LRPLALFGRASAGAYFLLNAQSQVEQKFANRSPWHEAAGRSGPAILIPAENWTRKTTAAIFIHAASVA